MQQVTSGQELANAIINNILGKDIVFPNTIQDPLKWPNSAVFGVEYKVHDSQFPQVKHEYEVAFFDNVAGLLQWLADKREWIRGTDYDFSMCYKVYQWDWGPVFKFMKQM